MGENLYHKNRGLPTVFAEAGKRAAGASQARRTIHAALARTTRARRRGPWRTGRAEMEGGDGPGFPPPCKCLKSLRRVAVDVGGFFG